MMKKLALFLALCMVLALPLTGCSQPDDPGTEPQTSEESGGETRTDLHLSLTDVPSMLDPHNCSLIVEQTIIL